MDNVLHNTITLLPCQIKIEPASDNEQDYEKEAITDSAVKQEVAEDDYLIKEEEMNHMQTSEDNEDISGANTHCQKSTIFIKKEGSSSIQGTDKFFPPVSTMDIVPHHIITSLSCQIKTEPASDTEQDYEQKSTTDNVLDSAIKQEVIEGYKIDECFIKEEGNQMQTSDCDEDSGAKTIGHESTLSDHPVVKSENDNIPQEFPNIVDSEEESMSDTMSEEMEVQQYYIETNDKKPYTCNVCAKTFKHLSQFKKHQVSHSNERLYSCDLCEKTFKRKHGLLQHKTCHSDERPYSCDVCEKTFKQKFILQLHKRSTHSNERPYSCDVCEKTFKQNCNLLQHKRICHSSERPHACDLCEKSFKRKSHLQEHKEACHSSERPYSCDMCGQRFKSNDFLQKHKISHSDERPFSCDMCEMAFKRKICLRNHKASSHSDERPHKCDVCGKSFKLQSNLILHKRIHTGEKSHECGICGKAFLQKQHVHLHIQRVHEKQSC